MERYKAWLCLKSAPLLGTKGMLELLQNYPDPQEFVGKPSHPVYQSGKLKPTTIKHLSEFTLPEDSKRIITLMEKHQLP